MADYNSAVIVTQTGSQVARPPVGCTFRNETWAGWVERDGDGGFAAVVVETPPPAPRKSGLGTYARQSVAVTANL